MASASSPASVLPDALMSNWNNPDEPEIPCGCGGYEEEHEIIERVHPDGYDLTVCHHSASCRCTEYRPRDSHWEQEQADDAAMERWERSRE